MALTQNPDRPSRFKDQATNRFVAVSVDDEVKEYGGKAS